MTLSRFLRDYVYFPLGGSRCSKIKTYRNLFVTFFLCGVWHGANWTFIIWGIIHGIAICIHRVFKQFELKAIPYISTLPMFVFVTLAWVVFRAETVHRAIDIYKSMFGLYGFAPIEINKFRFAFENGDLKLSLFLLIPSIIIIFCLPNSIEISKKYKPIWIFEFLSIILLTASIISINRVSEFLYFQF